MKIKLLITKLFRVKTIPYSYIFKGTSHGDLADEK